MSLVQAEPVAAGLDELLACAAERVRRRIRVLMPLAAPLIERWLDTVTGGGTLQAYFTHPRAFPTLLLPRWLGEAIGRRVDDALHVDLLYSTLQGYLAIRLVDDVMDGDGDGDRRLLPACAVFHAEFQSIYERRFPAGHAFWVEFERSWSGTADAAIADAALTEIDLDAFRAVTARKTSAALIPLAAAGHALGVGGVPAEWRSMVTRLAEWHQMRNDYFDWRRDLRSGAVTFVLSEAARRRDPGESTEQWMVREGLRGGLSELRERLRAARRAAHVARCRGALDHLQREEYELDRTSDVMERGLRVAARLLAT